MRLHDTQHSYLSTLNVHLNTERKRDRYDRRVLLYIKVRNDVNRSSYWPKVISRLIAIRKVFQNMGGPLVLLREQEAFLVCGVTTDGIETIKKGDKTE